MGWAAGGKGGRGRPRPPSLRGPCVLLPSRQKRWGVVCTKTPRGHGSHDFCQVRIEGGIRQTLFLLMSSGQSNPTPTDTAWGCSMAVRSASGRRSCAVPTALAWIGIKGVDYLFEELETGHYFKAVVVQQSMYRSNTYLSLTRVLCCACLGGVSVRRTCA